MASSAWCSSSLKIACGAEGMSNHQVGVMILVKLGTLGDIFVGRASAVCFKRSKAPPRHLERLAAKS